MGCSLKRIYSIRNTKGVVEYTNSLVLLKNVELVVQPSGRKETLRRMMEKHTIQKTVHAFLRGEIVRRGRNSKKEWASLQCKLNEITPVGYDPQKTNKWILLNGYRMPDKCDTYEPISIADYALLHEDGILVAH